MHKPEGIIAPGMIMTTHVTLLCYVTLISMVAIPIF